MLQLAKRNLSTAGGVSIPKRYFRCRKLVAKMSKACIDADLGRECGRHNKKHTCKEIFRKHPEIIMRWRKLFHALPGCDRLQRLIDFFRTAEPGTYQVLGQAMCRAAFADLTGVCIHTLTRAKQIADGTAAPNVAKPSRSPAYMAARAWLLDYAAIHSDSSPMSTNVYLPAGRQYFYHAAYAQDCRARGVPENQVGCVRTPPHAHVHNPTLAVHTHTHAFQVRTRPCTTHYTRARKCTARCTRFAA